MSCECATFDGDNGRFQCSVSGSECMYLIPNSKRCAIDYGEGPDADRDKDELLAELKAEYADLQDSDETESDDFDEDE